MRQLTAQRYCERDAGIHKTVLTSSSGFDLAYDMPVRKELIPQVQVCDVPHTFKGMSDLFDFLWHNPLQQKQKLKPNMPI